MQYIYGPRVVICVKRRLFWKDTTLPVGKWKSLRDRKQRARRFLVRFSLTGLKTQIYGTKLLTFWKICKAVTTFFFSSWIHLNSVNWLKGGRRWLLCVVGLYGRQRKYSAPICKCLLSGKINTWSDRIQRICLLEQVDFSHFLKSTWNWNCLLR